MTKVLFLIQGFDRPASRYRVLQFTEYLNANGVGCLVEVYPSSRKEWSPLEKLLPEVDAVFFQKKRPRRNEIKRIQAHGCRIVFDVDDAVMFKSSRHASHESASRMRAFGRACSAADLVIAGNGYLKSLAQEHASRVEVVPTSIDTSLYAVRQHAETPEEFIVGWIGGRKSLPFLERLGPALSAVRGRFPNVSLKVVSSHFPAMDGVPLIRTAWTEASEAAEVATFDVGLAPLPDDVWSRGKCATKLLQCMAAGVPCVASAVGVHREIVEPGVTGFLAGSDDEWVAGLTSLLGDGKRRAEMGRLCRETVEERYSLRAQQVRLLAFLRDLART